MPTESKRRQGSHNLPGDIVMGAVSIWKGLAVTLANFLRKKATVNYPFPDREDNYQPRPGYRGDFALLTDPETGRLRCTACMSCARVCPDGCIHIEGEGKGKDRKPVSFYIDLGLCMQCHLCVEACPFDALTMTPDYELADTDPRKLIRNLEALAERGDEYTEVQRVWAPSAAPAKEAEPTP